MSSTDLPCACTALRKAARAAVRLYDGCMEGTGINIGQFAILRTLQRTPDQPLSRLAEAMVMDRTSLYRALAPMVRQGWIDVAAGAGRAKIARLTAQGVAVADAATPHWQTAQAGFMDAIGHDSWAKLSVLLRQVADRAAAP